MSRAFYSAALPLLGAMGVAVGLFVAGCGQDRGAEETTGTTATVAQVEVANSPELQEATEEYESYVVSQADDLVAETQDFTEAVVAGDVEGAKREYAPARVPWERIEPIAATLGDLDPRIDAREGDVSEDEWGGFHKIEQALWEEDTTEGQAETARQLQSDVEEIRREAEGLDLAPEDLVVGSIELLNEVSAGKITGEEERYSHTDLYDIQANVEGSEAAYNALEPALRDRDAELADEVDARFEDVYSTLEPYREGENGWVPYTELDEADRRELSQAIDALAEPLSQVGQVLEG
jgi:iron uptake system component EfeO